MCKMNLLPPKFIVTLLLFSIITLTATNAHAQQDVIANKMNTRTDVTRPFSTQTGISFFSGTRLSNRTEIQRPAFSNEETLAVTIFPTIITENMLHATTVLPVEKITVNTINGRQVFVQYVGGKDYSLSIPLPASLGKGMYWVTFTGQGWQTTGKIIIP